MVSVGMPVYNCAETVGSAIRSILNQSYENWELLIVDDGSVDGTVEVARSFTDARIKIFADGEHQGLVARLNQAVAMSGGEYFARMDGDDVAFPERLRRQVEFLVENGHVNLMGCGVMVFGVQGAALGTRRVAETHEEICRRPWAGFQLPHPTWMGRREWFRAHPYDAEATRAEDQVLLLRNYGSSCFACVPEILQGYCEGELVLRKILRGRLSFTMAMFWEFWRRGEYLTALGGTLEQCAKGLLDVLAISTGLDYRILRHRARPVAAEIVKRWSEVWTQVQEQRQPTLLCGG